MGAAVARVGLSIDQARHISARSHAVPILQLFALTVMVLPSNAVIKAIGAQGYAAALVGMFAFVTHELVAGLYTSSLAKPFEELRPPTT